MRRTLRYAFLVSWAWAVWAVCGVLIASGATSSMNSNASALTQANVAPLPPGSNVLYTKLYARIPGHLRPWISQEAQALSAGRTDGANWPSPNDPALAGQNMSGADIEALAFIVMMQATNDMDSDLKAIMDEVKAQNAAKQKLRDLINQMNAAQANNPGGLKEVQPTPTPSANTVLALKNKLDSMNEMSEMTSLRLQMLMDRRSKFIQTLSNIMKSISNTQDNLIQNLK